MFKTFTASINNVKVLATEQIRSQTKQKQLKTLIGDAHAHTK